MELKNTILISTDDERLEEVLNDFLARYCEVNEVNAAVYGLNYKFAKEVKGKMFE